MTRNTLIALATLVLISLPALGQGTATGPSTMHIVGPGSSNAYVGGPNDTINGPAPYPIDLDPTGPPWRKTFQSDPAAGGLIGFGGITIVETIVNTGAEPWFDWHEEIVPNSGALGVFWFNVPLVAVNGNPIGFNQTIMGNSLWLDGFVQPVLPGDVLTIEKDLITTLNLVNPGVTLFQVLEYPTPEPGSLALLGLGVVLIARRPGVR